MKIFNEITLEITNYCENSCKFCSSNATSIRSEVKNLSYEFIKSLLKNKRFNHIILSGGEPLAHPRFYDIFKLCENHTDDVIVYSNLIKHRIYNLHVIDGVYLEGKITPTNSTDKISILKRVEQGREAIRPEVTFSRNYTEECNCGNLVIKSDGSLSETPCRKNGNTDRSFKDK